LKRRAGGLILLLLTVMLVGVFAWRFWMGGDERAIEKVLWRGMELVNKDQQEGDLTAISRAGELAGLFTIPFTIQPLPNITGRAIADADELRAMVFRARSAVDRIDVEVLDLRLEVVTPGEEALMWIAVQGAFDGNPELSEAIERYRVRWRKTSGDWKIAEIEPADTIHVPKR
jgi:hypothetical protein